MPRLSLWRPQKSNDYRFFDRTIKEMFTVGATDLYVHKYLGISDQGPSTDATQPQYLNPNPTQIQDLLFLENRDRKYAPDIYRLRGHYNVQNLDFDLSQFGLFLSNDTIFITVHYNDMIDILGRKLMVGDVLELPHLTDYHPLNETIPVALRRYYQVTDGNYASEGFSQTWYPHLWRIKCEPLVNSQEFADILNQPISKDNYLGDWDPNREYIIPAGQTYTITYGGKIYQITGADPDGTTVPPGTRPDVLGGPWTISPEQNLIDILSTYNKNLEINQANIDEAKNILPQAGYDNSPFYVVPTFLDNQPAPPVDVLTTSNAFGPNPSTRATGHINFVQSNYRIASPVIRISAAALENINNMMINAGSDMTIDQFIGMSLRAAEIAPEKTEGGSGALVGDMILTARALGPVTSPYGTADNTYATADAYISFILTAMATGTSSNTIQLDETSDLQDLFPQYSVGCLLSVEVVTEDGTIVSALAPDTRIAAVDLELRTITLNKPTVANIPGGTAVTVNPDFTGEVTPQMDWRADCDPRFQFIKRSSPRSFGYAAGYLTGGTEAPNGEATGSGISFPANPQLGDYFLRIDYYPQKLFRFDGAVWVEISSDVRTGTGFGVDDRSQLSSFINNENRVALTDGGTVPSRQSLSKAFLIQPD